MSAGADRLREQIAWARASAQAEPVRAAQVLEGILTDPGAVSLSPVEMGGVHTYLAFVCEILVKAGVASALDPGLLHVSEALPLLGMEVELADWTLARLTAARLLGLHTPGDRRKAAIEEAIKLLEASLRIGGQRLKTGALVMLVVHLADLYRNRLAGDLPASVERAIAYLRATLASLTSDAPPDLVVPLQLNLGAALVERPAGDHSENVEEAISLYQDALTALGDARMPETRAQLQQNLAAAYLRRGGHDRVRDAGAAIDACSAALHVFTREKRRAQWLWTILNLTAAYVLRIEEDTTGVTRLADAGQAIRLAEDALTVTDRNADSLQWADLKANAGGAYATAGQTDKAIACYRQALEVSRPETSSLRCRIAATNLGRLYASRRQWPAAADAYVLAIEALEGAYQDAEARWSREAELGRDNSLYRAAAAALARAGRLRQAVQVAERGRARALTEALDRDRPDTRLTSIDPGLALRYREAGARVAALDRPRPPAPGITGPARAELAAVVEEIRRQPGLEDFLRPPDLAGIAAVLEPAEALAYAITAIEGSIFLVVHQGPGGPDVDAVWADDFPTAQLDRFLTGAALDSGGQAVPGSSYLASQLGGRGDLAAALGRGLPDLGRQLAAPLAGKLRELRARAVVLVPTGLLSLVPLHAAPLDAQGSCLLDQVTVRFSPSARALAPAGEAARGPGAGAGRRLVAVADPTGSLIWAAAECAAVAAAASGAGMTASVQAGAGATRGRLLEALGEATMVHVATHGRFDSSNPLLSELVLAGKPLTLADLLEEDALGNVDLVVASACQTGITDVTRLPDEALGLPAGFLHAGASAAIATLWPVQDASTALLMAAFYARLFSGGGPADPAAALAGAQIWLRDSTARQLREFASSRAPALEESLAFKAADDPPYSHAYYWAPFMLVGR